MKEKGKNKKGVIPERERISGGQVRVDGDWEEAEGMGKAFNPHLSLLSLALWVLHFCSHSLPCHTTFSCLLFSPLYSPIFLPYDFLSLWILCLFLSFTSILFSSTLGSILLPSEIAVLSEELCLLQTMYLSISSLMKYLPLCHFSTIIWGASSSKGHLPRGWKEMECRRCATVARSSLTCPKPQ